MTTLNQSKNLAGVLILAGGRSTRMGSPKAMLKLPTGQTLLDYHVAQAKSLGVPIFIADNEQGFAINADLNKNSLSKNYANDNKTEQPIITHLKDYKPNNSNSNSKNSDTNKEKHSAGPLSAIMSGLQHLTNEPNNKPTSNHWMLVISCDSLINAPDVWQLIKNKLDSNPTVSKQIICLNDDENLYPLLALYQLQLADDLKTYLDDGQRRVMGFIKPKCHTVMMPKTWSHLSNLNTPAQFKLACQQVFNTTLTK